VAAEQPQNELTSTIHLGLREVTDPSKNHLDEQLALLSPEDRAVISEIQGSAGEKAMILIARGPNKGDTPPRPVRLRQQQERKCVQEIEGCSTYARNDFKRRQQLCFKGCRFS